MMMELGGLGSGFSGVFAVGEVGLWVGRGLFYVGSD